MKNPTCFVAGTMILTASRLVAIESIKAGDKVISTNAETFEVTEKTVVDIVNIGLHFFSRIFDLMLTPVGKHSIAVV